MEGDGAPLYSFVGVWGRGGGEGQEGGNGLRHLSLSNMDSD